MTGSGPGAFGRTLGALYVLHGVNVVVPFVLLPYLTRTLAAEAYGLVAFSQSFVWFFLVVVNWGFSLSATRAAAQARDDPPALARLLADVLGARLVLLAVATIVFAALVVALPELRAHAGLHALVFATVVGQAIFPLWLFQGLERVVVLAAVNAALRLAALAATLALVRGPADAPVYAALLGAQWVLTGAIGLLLIGRVAGIKALAPRLEGMRRAVVEAWSLFLSNVANALYTGVNPFLLGLFASYEAVGLYGGAERVMFGALGLLAPLSQAVFPRASFLRARAPAEAAAFARRLLALMAGLGATAALALFLAADLVARLYLGEAFAAAGPVLALLAPVVLLLALVNVLGLQIMIPLGHDRAYRNALVVMAAVNVAGATVLAPAGASGMALAVLLSAGSGAALMAAHLARHGELPYLSRRPG
jgi:PST family polysaccharide transporter